MHEFIVNKLIAALAFTLLVARVTLAANDSDIAGSWEVATTYNGGLPSTAGLELTRNGDKYTGKSGWLVPSYALFEYTGAREKNGVRLTRLAHREARRLKLDPQGVDDPYSFAIREEIDSVQLSADSDYRAVRDGCVSITPLAMECADIATLAGLEKWIRRGGDIPDRG